MLSTERTCINVLSVDLILPHQFLPFASIYILSSSARSNSQTGLQKNNGAKVLAAYGIQSCFHPMIAEDILVCFSHLLNSRHLVLDDFLYVPVVGNVRNTFFLSRQKASLKNRSLFLRQNSCPGFCLTCTHISFHMN